MKLIVSTDRGPTIKRSTHVARRGLASPLAFNFRSMSQARSAKRGVHGMRMSAAGGLRPSDPPLWTKVA